jgi:hypothetical protein
MQMGEKMVGIPERKSTKMKKIKLYNFGITVKD